MLIIARAAVPFLIIFQRKNVGKESADYTFKLQLSHWLSTLKELLKMKNHFQNVFPGITKSVNTLF